MTTETSSPGLLGRVRDYWNNRPTVTWAEGLCSAIVIYRSSITDAATNLKEGNVSKSALDDAAESVNDATKTFVDSVHGLGQPETKAGGEIKQTLDGLATSLQTDFQAIQDATSGSSSALSVVSAVSATLTTARSQVSAAVASASFTTAPSTPRFTRNSPCRRF